MRGPFLAIGSSLKTPIMMKEKILLNVLYIFRHGKPDLFITKTCNPMWKEIQDELLDGQKAEDRPDLVSRVFQMRLAQFEKDILEDGIFGSRIANMRVIEFQKRGLPHAHLLIILQERHAIKTADHVDKIVCAEIPPHPLSIVDADEDKQKLKRDQAERLRNIVLKNMVHGPCGKENRMHHACTTIKEK